MTDYLMSIKKRYDINVETKEIMNHILLQFFDSDANVIVTIGTILSQTCYTYFAFEISHLVIFKLSI